MGDNSVGDEPEEELWRGTRRAATPKAEEALVGPEDCPLPTVITANTEGGSVELEAISGPPDFSVNTQFDETDPRFQALSASYEGPLPPPSYLRGYDEIVPGAAREIISWVKEESEHRRRLEVEESKHRRGLEVRAMDLGEKSLNWGIFRATAGLFLAWPLMGGVVVAGYFLIQAGHDWAGTVIVSTGLTLIGGSYVVNKITKWKRAQKSGKDESSADEEGEHSDTDTEQ